MKARVRIFFTAGWTCRSVNPVFSDDLEKAFVPLFSPLSADCRFPTRCSIPILSLTLSLPLNPICVSTIDKRNSEYVFVCCPFPRSQPLAVASAFLPPSLSTGHHRLCDFFFFPTLDYKPLIEKSNS